MRKSVSRFIRSITICATMFGAAQAFAGYTQVKAPPVGEQSCDQILSHLYGGTFTASGKDFTNGGITAHRVEDQSLATGSMQIPVGYAGSSADQMFNAKKFSAKAVAKFSLNSQTLGMDYGSGFEKLFDVSGYGYNVHGQSNGNAFGNDFSFDRKGDSGLQSSDNSQNLDGRDHVVTYCVEGLGETRWLMFWEDLNLSPNISKKRSSSDFNDVVVELQARPTTIPLPAAVYPGLSMLLGGGLLGKLRRKR